MKTRSYFEEFLHLTNPRTLKEDVEIDVKEPVEDDTEAADGAVVAPIIDPEMGYDMGDADDTQVEQDGSAYIGKSVVDCHVCNNAFFIDAMEIPEELVCPVCAAPAADLELVGIVEPIPEEEPATTDNNDEQSDDSDDEDNDEQEGNYDSEDSDEDNVGESAGKADLYKKAKMAESNKHISKLTEGYEDLTVWELATILQDALDILSGHDDDAVIVTQSNTYGMYGDFIGVHGKGYVELDNINIEDYEDMDNEEDMDESLKKLEALPQVKKAQRASGVVKTNAKANINKGKSVAESRQAMSKKIKDIYENRRAAQNTQVKKKSDLTNEAINPENAKDNAVLKNIMLGRGNKKLSANPATDNTIYLHTTRNTYDLYLANKETHRRVGSFDKDSTDPKGLNAVDLISFLNSESEPMRDFTTKASRLNRNTDIARRTDGTIRLYQDIADPNYIQLLQSRLDDRKEHLRNLQQTKSYSDKTAFAYRRYMDDTVNDNITAYKKLKRDLDYTQGRLKSAKDKIAASTSKWTIQQLQNEIAELQKQLDKALSGVGDEEDEQRVKDFEKRAQEIRAKIDDLFAKVKGSTGNK